VKTILPRNLQMRGYRTMLAYAGRSARGWTLVLLVTILSTAASLLSPWPMKVLVDSVLGGHHAPDVFTLLPGTGSAQVLLVYVAFGTLVLYAVAAALDVWLTTLWVQVGQGMVYALSRDVFARLQRRSLRFHQQNPVGDSMTRVSGDTWAVHTVVDTLLFAPLHNVLLLGSMVVLMARMNLTLTGVALAVTPLLAWASRVFGKPIRAAGEQKRLVQGELRSHVHQLLTGITVVQAFGQERRMRRRFGALATAAVAAEQRSVVVSNVNALFSGAVNTVGRGVVLYFGAQAVLHHHLSVGGLLVFVAYLGSLQGALGGFAGVYPALQSVRPQIDRVMEVLGADPDVVEGPGAVSVGRVAGGVELEGVVFGYLPARPVLRGVSLAVAPGETVAVVGATGAGKSTLMSLLLRFYDPEQGRVLIDGRDVRELTLASLRAQLGLVLQESFLLPVSIADNIAFGRPGATRAEVIEAAKVANADEFINALPAGYDTIVGERGATLSGGERQRIAIARAVVKDAPILILDEPTSALDAVTEHSLLEALDRLMDGRTTFVIAHRLSTIRRADRIVVLDHGQVVETGTHTALLKAPGHYATLWHLQHGSHEVAPRREAVQVSG
jgi:ATP-binding cassette subfamily B protein